MDHITQQCMKLYLLGEMDVPPPDVKQFPPQSGTDNSYSYALSALTIEEVLYLVCDLESNFNFWL